MILLQKAVCLSSNIVMILKDDLTHIDPFPSFVPFEEYTSILKVYDIPTAPLLPLLLSEPRSGHTCWSIHVTMFLSHRSCLALLPLS